jgi:UPF0716 family protein affecting phage T7 exclusion
MTTPPTPQATPSTGNQPPLDDATTQLVAAFIKKNWDSHYRAAWNKFGSPTGLRRGTSWNWPAALVPFLWLLYRRQFLYGFAWLGASLLLGMVPLIGFFAWIASIILLGMYGDRIILNRAWQAADSALRQHGPGDQAIKEVTASGGVSNVLLGCVLILPGIFIIGILAAIAIPKFSHAKQRAYRAVMRSDLQALLTAEEKYYVDSSRYTADVGSLFVPSTGVSSPAITVAHKAFSATVTHLQLPGVSCGIAVGMPNPVGVGGEGEIVCK